MASSDDPDFEASVHEPLRHGPDPQANPLDLGLATQSQTLLSKLFEKLAWGSLALLIGYSLWSTCDTTISVGAGESLPHIALALLAFLGASFCMRGALGVGSQSEIGRAHV